MQDTAIGPNEDAAIARYRAYLAADPGNALLRLNLGDLLHRAGRFDEAETCFAACRDDPTYGRSAQGHLAKLRLSQNRLAEAEALLRALIDGHGEGHGEGGAGGDSDPALQHNLGIALYHQQRWADAQAAFEAARSGGRPTAATLRYLAYCLHQQNRSAEAHALAQAWLEAAPSDEAMGYLSLLDLDIGQRESAEARADEALRLNPDNVDAAYVKSVGMIQRQDMDQAERLLTRVLERQPQSFRALQGLGVVCYYRQQFDQAIQYLERALKVVPNQVGTLVTIGWAHVAKKDPMQAERAFRRAVAASPSFGEAHGGLATALALQRRVKEAAESAERARRLDRRGFGATYAQSILLALQGREDAATDLVERALERPLGPDQVDLSEAIATYVTRQGLSAPPDTGPGRLH